MLPYLLRLPPLNFLFVYLILPKLSHPTKPQTLSYMQNSFAASLIRVTIMMLFMMRRGEGEEGDSQAWGGKKHDEGQTLLNHFFVSCVWVCHVKCI